MSNANLDINLRVKNADFKSKLDKSGKDLKDFGSSLTSGFGSAIMGGVTSALAAAGAAVVGFGALVAQQFGKIDSAFESADKIGIGVEALTGLEHAAQMSGSSVDALHGFLTKMQNTLGEANAGSAEAQQAFRQLGLDEVALKGMKAEEAFMAIGEAVNKLGSSSSKMKALQDIGGKGGSDLAGMFKNGADGVRELMDEAERLGVVVGESARPVTQLMDEWDRMKAAGVGALIAIAVETAPAVEAMLKLGSTIIQTAKQTEGLDTGSMVENQRSGFQVLEFAIMNFGDVAEKEWLFFSLYAVMAFNDVVFAGQALWDNIVTIGTAIWDAFFFEEIQETATTSFQEIESSGQSLWEQFIEFGEGILQAIHWEDMKEIALNAFNEISTAAESLIAHFRTVGNIIADMLAALNLKPLTGRAMTEWEQDTAKRVNEIGSRLQGEFNGFKGQRDEAFKPTKQKEDFVGPPEPEKELKKKEEKEKKEKKPDKFEAAKNFGMGTKEAAEQILQARGQQKEAKEMVKETKNNGKTLVKILQAFDDGTEIIKIGTL